MTNINLYQRDFEKEHLVKNKKIADKGLIISVCVLLFTLLVLGGLKIYSRTIDDKISAVRNQIEGENKTIGLENTDMRRVADFQARMDVIEKNIASKTDPAINLEKIEKTIVAGSLLKSLEYSAGNFSLTLVTDNFQVMARQILSFKKSGFFKNVGIDKVYRSSEDNKIEYTAQLRSN